MENRKKRWNFVKKSFSRNRQREDPSIGGTSGDEEELQKYEMKDLKGLNLFQLCFV